jgi:hypothetical protein
MKKKRKRPVNEYYNVLPNSILYDYDLSTPGKLLMAALTTVPIIYDKECAVTRDMQEMLCWDAHTMRRAINDCVECRYIEYRGDHTTPYLAEQFRVIERIRG